MIFAKKLKVYFAVFQKNSQNQSIRNTNTTPY